MIKSAPTPANGIEITKDSSTMHPEIATIVCAIMEAANPAARSETIKDEKGETRFAYASVDDIFEAVQTEMGHQGLISEMILAGPPEFISLWDNECQKERPALSMMFRFQLTTKSGARYADPDNLWPIVAWFEGTKTTTSARSTAHKHALRDLFKIRTTDPSVAEAVSTVRAEAVANTFKSTPEPNGGTTVKKRGRPPKNPLMMNEEESEIARVAILSQLSIAAACQNGDTAATALKDTYRSNGATIARLRPEDSAAVSKRYGELTDEVKRAGNSGNGNGDTQTTPETETSEA